MFEKLWKILGEREKKWLEEEGARRMVEKLIKKSPQIIELKKIKEKCEKNEHFPSFTLLNMEDGLIINEFIKKYPEQKGLVKKCEGQKMYPYEIMGEIYGQVGEPFLEFIKNKRKTLVTKHVT